MQKRNSHIVRSSLKLVQFVCVFALLLQVTVIRAPVLAQRWQCDPELKERSGDPFGYHLRNGRCEGVYIRQVASTTLHVASFVESFENVDLTSGRSFVIAWDSPTGETVHLRAESLRRQLNYQMDTVRPGGTSSFSWPTDTLSQFTLQKRELGIVARISYSLAGQNRDVYVPVRISQQGSSSKTPRYRVALLPGAELGEVFLSLAPVKADGSLGSFIMRDRRLGDNFYPAERPIEIDIPKPGRPGIYQLEIGARLRAGGSASMKLWFYRPH